MKVSTPELSPIQQHYKANRAFVTNDLTKARCSKCGRVTKPREIAYKDAMTGVVSHITCKSKKAKPDEPIES